MDFGGSPVSSGSPPMAPANAPTVGETLGSGPVRVGMILPLTQNGGPSPIGVSMRNAAQLAIDDFGASYVTLMIQDDHSSSDGAAQAAQSELGAGAQIILGPVFANDVRAASAAAKSAGRPMIAFSTDVSVAAPGVYLLSFLIESYVDRIVQYAVSNGKKSFAIMAPQNDYGNVAAERFQETAAGANAQIVVTARYSAGQMATAAQQVAAAQGQIDALFIPEQADAMQAVANALSSNSIKTQLLGTGVWNDARVLKLAQMQGAWFSAPDNSGFNAFAQRYKAKFNAEPARLATLSYDATTLAAALARNGGPDPYNERALTNVSGFSGADGVFRFRADGTNERGLAVIQIDNDAAKVISPAPRSFAAG
jgi:branched-chain amino acid transport system substrate-binding protein